MGFNGRRFLAVQAVGEAGEAPQATIIKHPLQVAPPHSIKPPPPAGEEQAVPATGDDPSEKSA